MNQAGSGDVRIVTLKLSKKDVETILESLRYSKRRISEYHRRTPGNEEIERTSLEPIERVEGTLRAAKRGSR